jgi:NAD(P)H-flavin reductase
MSPPRPGPRECCLCELRANTPVNDAIFRLEFAWPGPAPRAGQFFLIRPCRTSVLLGRPISVFGWDGPSALLRFLIAKRGRGTGELAALGAGEKAELIGPLGNAWADAALQGTSAPGGIRPPQGTAARLLPALISGGIGVAPLAALGAELEPGAFDFYAGFRTGAFGLEGLRPRSLCIATEDGSAGLRGRIPDFLEPAKYAAVYACGPGAMLKAVAESCKKAGVPCFVSLERRMACGVGACLGCTVRTAGGNRRCCADGPVFPAEELLFDE